MRPKDLTGAVIDRFFYDTPDQAQADFYDLCNGDKPLVLVFLPNFGHPISRVYLTRYVDSLSQLVSGRLACVVHSDPKNIAAKLDKTYPFPLICDAAGTLYEYFGVQTTTSRMAWSFMAMRIFREAKKQGYQVEKNTEQLLPLTLVIGAGGKVLFSHYGESLTDLPEDCSAMERVCGKLMTSPNAKQAPAQASPAEETAAPAQNAPDLTAGSQQVMFPGQESQEAEEPEKDAATKDADQTQPIDLSGWIQPEAVEEDDEEEDDAPRWNKLVGLFADRDKTND